MFLGRRITTAPLLLFIYCSYSHCDVNSCAVSLNVDPSNPGTLCFSEGIRISLMYQHLRALQLSTYRRQFISINLNVLIASVPKDELLRGPLHMHILQLRRSPTPTLLTHKRIMLSSVTQLAVSSSIQAPTNQDHIRSRGRRYMVHTLSTPQQPSSDSSASRDKAPP